MANPFSTNQWLNFDPTCSCNRLLKGYIKSDLSTINGEQLGFKIKLDQFVHPFKADNQVVYF